MVSFMYSFAEDYSEDNDYETYWANDCQEYEKQYKKYKFSGYVNETDKAVLLIFGDVAKWIPKSVIRSINYKKMNIVVHKGVFKGCTTTQVKGKYVPESVKNKLPYLHPYYSVLFGIVEKFIWEGSDFDFDMLKEGNVFLTKSMANLFKEGCT